MYNILLTDDEQIMIDSLTFIIEKNFPGQVHLFSSLSGPGALDITSKNQIDIIFMDINMPGLNGLETLRCITQSKPDTIIIILSAFDRFQYAQEAVNLGAYKYLTKPVNRNMVIETLRGAMTTVDARRGRLSTEVELHRRLDFVSPMVESDFIYSAVFSSDRDVTEYLRYFNITDSCWCFFCIEVPHIESKNQYDLYMKIRDTLTSKCRCLIGSFMLNRIVVFMPIPGSGEKNETAETMKTQIRNLFTLLSLNISSGIRVGISYAESDQARTAAAYNDALEALSRVPAEGGIIFADEGCGAVSAEKNAGETADKIFARIRAGDSAGAAPLINTYCTLLDSRYAGDMNRIKNALFELLINVRNITTEIDTSYQNEEFSNSFAFLSAENSMAQLQEFVQKRCSECAAHILSMHSNLENPIIGKVCTYIMDHISDDISLDSAALAVNVSPFYLSKLFKEKKGQNFIAYVTDIRLEKARELLRDPRSSVKEVSAAAGYNDQNYFSKIFRNKFGMSPTEFRDSSGTAVQEI
jgi:two-component system response regulator YesN